MAETDVLKYVDQHFTGSLTAGAPNPITLVEEVQAKPEIVTGFTDKKVFVDGNTVHLYFKGPITGSEDVALNEVCDAHTGEITIGVPTQNVTIMSSSVQLPIDAGKTSDGRLLMAPTYSQFEEDAKFKGIQIEAPTSGTYINDILVTTQIYMNSGMLWTYGGNCGDYVEFSIIDKDDVLGLFGMYGLQTGSDVLELKKPVETQYYSPQGTPMVMMPTPDIAEVIPGLYIRTKLENVGPSGSCIGVTYLWFEA